MPKAEKQGILATLGRWKNCIYTFCDINLTKTCYIFLLIVISGVFLIALYLDQVTLSWADLWVES